MTRDEPGTPGPRRPSYPTRRKLGENTPSEVIAVWVYTALGKGRQAVRGPNTVDVTLTPVAPGPGPVDDQRGARIRGPARGRLDAAHAAPGRGCRTGDRRPELPRSGDGQGHGASRPQDGGPRPSTSSPTAWACCPSTASADHRRVDPIGPSRLCDGPAQPGTAGGFPMPYLAVDSRRSYAEEE